MLPLLRGLAMKNKRKSETDQAISVIVPTDLWKSTKKFDNGASEDYRAQLQF